MNQILSVELPKKRSKIKTGQNNNKVSTKSAVTFFSIVLILFGLALIGVSIYSFIGSKENTETTKLDNLPRIDVAQNATELEIEITCASEIASVEYNWEGKEVEKAKTNGRNNMNLKLDIPSGNNIFTMKVTDTEGRKNEYSQEYVGPKEPNITQFDPTQIRNNITVKCEEEQIIKEMSYYYDDEPETKTIINSKEGTINIPEKQGEHNLTIKAEYEDGTTGKITKKVYVPVLKISPNGVGKYTKFIINASSTRTIDKVTIEFNGVSSEEQVNKETYYKELDLKPGDPGSNVLKIIVYDKEGMSYSKYVSDSNRQK